MTWLSSFFFGSGGITTVLVPVVSMEATLTEDNIEAVDTAEYPVIEYLSGGVEVIDETIAAASEGPIEAVSNG